MHGALYTVCTTEDVIAEVIYTLRREKPDAPGHLTRHVHDQITESLDYRVEDYPSGDAGYPGADPYDLHVHAAAVASGVGVVLTADKGFTDLSPDQLDLLPYEVYHPDDFFVLVDDSSPTVVRATAATQMDYWLGRNPTGFNLAESLEKSGRPQFADRLRRRLQEI